VEGDGYSSRESMSQPQMEGEESQAAERKQVEGGGDGEKKCYGQRLEADHDSRHCQHPVGQRREARAERPPGFGVSEGGVFNYD